MWIEHVNQGAYSIQFAIRNWIGSHSSTGYIGRLLHWRYFIKCLLHCINGGMLQQITSDTKVTSIRELQFLVSFRFVLIPHRAYELCKQFAANRTWKIELTNPKCNSLLSMWLEFRFMEWLIEVCQFCVA